MKITIETPGAVDRSPDLRADVIVVIDVLRATSTAAVLGSRTERLKLVPRPKDLPGLPGSPSDYLVFSELTNEGFERVDNSPSRAATIDLAGRTPVLVTTNGTIAAQIACAHSSSVFLCSFLNISAVARAVRALQPESVILLPAGKVSNDTRCKEDDQCAEALRMLLQEQNVELQSMADECRNAPLIIQRLLDEDGLIVDVDYALRPDVVETVQQVHKLSETQFEIR